MPFVEALKLALSAILSHKLRSFLTLLGVIFGVATVIVVVSLIEGFNAYVDEKIADIESKIATLRKMKKALARLSTACGEREPTADCPILEALDGRQPRRTRKG